MSFFLGEVFVYKFTSRLIFWIVFVINCSTFSGPILGSNPTMSHHSAKLSAANASSNVPRKFFSRLSRTLASFIFRYSITSSDQGRPGLPANRIDHRIGESFQIIFNGTEPHFMNGLLHEKTAC